MFIFSIFVVSEANDPIFKTIHLIIMSHPPSSFDEMVGMWLSMKKIKILLNHTPPREMITFMNHVYRVEVEINDIRNLLDLISLFTVNWHDLLWESIVL